MTPPKRRQKRTRGGEGGLGPRNLRTAQRGDRPFHTPNLRLEDRHRSPANAEFDANRA